MPAWQVSSCVHAFLSLQVVPLATGSWVQTPLTTFSTVQGLPSSGQTSIGQALLGGLEAGEQKSRSQAICWVANPAGKSKS